LKLAGNGIERRIYGTGALVCANGSTIPIGPFRIEQTSSGRTFLYFEKTLQLALKVGLRRLESFHGQTKAGQPIRTHGDLLERCDTQRELCFVIRKIELGRSMPDGHFHELSLTNLHFPVENPGVVAFTVQWGDATVPIRLIPRRNYQERIRELRKMRGIIPTATLKFNSESFSGSALSEFIADLCSALSLVQGGTINWIYRGTYGPGKSFQYAVFGETITKTTSSQLLCSNPATRGGVILALTDAADALTPIKRFREAFDPYCRLIKAWLDARTQTDYIEGRTLKYVVVIEALNALTTHADKTIATKVRDPKAWRQLYERNILPAMPAEAADWLTLQNWQRLNDRSFRDTLEAVFRIHHVAVPLEDVALFTKIRNAIVHRFDYDYDIKLPNQWEIPENPQAAQHYFTAAFVDRIMLQLFGLRPASGI
jgi:hypothetical protein